ncbi:NAD-dependent epimerase/dehydratase family protein [Pseudoalteromonas sp. JC28]|uniref:UDP-glucose 4-epimerase family protein n=1 Tax=Pseudoalteromonas sp. JC28 TaxID=2267617 RepID=UPI0015741E31|nr:SDR family oxidoreductase [Pseudoalteromonas sp. JC28]NSY35190.1 NAD-dependent epimerase/dehydratase family protein [Pseudoalteromonas sp. JC28]
MNILVTGYSGFVGSELSKCIYQKHNLSFLGRKPSSYGVVHQANIDGQSDFTTALESIDVVIHCAARVHVMNDSVADLLEAFKVVNTMGTLNLANQAKKAGVKRFIFVSSVKVNGESTSDSKPFCASDEPKPRDPYGVSKAEAEMQLVALGKETNMEIVIIRPPLVYGEGVKANFASLMKYVGKGLPLPFRSINKNKRSLVSVYNLVDLIKVCIDHPKAANQIFLVSDGHDLSTAEMVALMAKVQNKKKLALPVPVWCFNFAGKLLNKQDVIDRLTGSLELDITHTKNTLNWSPPYSVEHGFKLAAKK